MGVNVSKCVGIYMCGVCVYLCGCVDVCVEMTHKSVQ